MNVKARYIFVACALMACVIILPYCHSNPRDTAPYHSFLKTEEFKKLGRTDQVMKCAGCHKLEFENEKKGPHSNAYQKLRDHRTFVNSDRYNCDFYTRRVNRDFENCAGCHTPQNLWQTMLYDSLTDKENIVANLMKIEHPMPKSRTGDTSRLASIDCFSCHYDGEKMVSLKHVFTKDDSIPTKQTLATRTANNMSCFPCHADIIRTISPEFAIRKTGSVQCTSCHQETGAKGKGTHYFYWKHNPTDKVNPDLAAMVNDWQFHLNPGKQSGEIVWVNNTMPHKMSDGPELIFKCEILDKDSNVLGSKTIRLNNKEQFDKEMYNQVEQHYLYGENGDVVLLDGTAHRYKMGLKNPSKANIFRISLVDKAQYWFPDSLGTLTVIKNMSIQ